MVSSRVNGRDDRYRLGWNGADRSIIIMMMMPQMNNDDDYE